MKTVSAKSSDNNMVEGNITKSILWFAFPILIGNVFQQLYNVVDTAIIGNVLGDQALAAVGASAPLYSLVIGFAGGMTNGFSVILARFFGAGNEKEMKKTVAWTYLLTLFVSVVLTAVSLMILKPVLTMLKTPEEILEQTDDYLRVILAFAVITCLYNMLSGIMRAIGDSKTPLYFLIVSSFINVVLDILFVKYMGFGIAGAAYATVIAEIVSVILCFIFIYRRQRILAFSGKYLKRDRELVGELLSMGFSMGLMLVVVSIGSVALQSAVNFLGSDTIAAHTAARKIDDIFMWPLGTLSMAASTFTGQNLGAHKIDRIYKGIRNTIGIAMAWSLFSISMVFLFGKGMIKMISGTSNAEIIDTAYRYICINVVFFVVLSVLLVLRSSLQGIGRKIVPILGSVVELVLKFGAVGIITQRLGYFGVCVLEPVIWCVCALLVFIDFLVFCRQVRSGTFQVIKKEETKKQMIRGT